MIIPSETRDDYFNSAYMHIGMVMTQEYVWHMSCYLFSGGKESGVTLVGWCFSPAH